MDKKTRVLQPNAISNIDMNSKRGKCVKNDAIKLRRQFNFVIIENSKIFGVELLFSFKEPNNSRHALIEKKKKGKKKNTIRLLQIIIKIRVPHQI